MSRIQYTVVILFLFIAVNRIYCASLITKNEIYNVTQGDLQISDDSATGNSSLKARLRTKRWIEEYPDIETTSSESIEKNETDSIYYSDPVSTSDFQKFLRNRSPQGHSGREHGPYARSQNGHHPGGHNGSHLTKVRMPTGKMANNSVPVNRWIEDEYPYLETPSSESLEKNETNSIHYSDPVSTSDFQKFIKFIRRPQARSGREHGPNARSHYGHHPGGHHDHHPGGHNGLHWTKVRMPTGKMANISVPNQLRHWKRGRETLLINLDPDGTTGYDAEFDLVANVVRSTKIHKHFSDYDFIKIEKIVNGGFWTKYRNTQKYIYDEVGFVNERMLFHGTSKAEDILKNGFDERHTKIPGNMFGAGLYFAEHSSKSNGYAFGNGKGCAVHKDVNCDKCERQMMLCRVALGNMQKETFAKLIAHPDPGYNSVKGEVSPGGLKYPEYIVYKGEQVYPEYLVTYKIVI